MAVFASSQIVPLLSALGLDGRKAIASGEVDPVVYLLEQAGADLGYSFEWERYGPFSQDLAADLVDMTPEDLEELGELDERVRGAVDRVRAIIEPEFPDLTEFTWIRLLASVHFLQHVSGLRLDNGRRPPYLSGSLFEQRMIDEAVRRVAALSDDL
jgi:hypothetical protein